MKTLLITIITLIIGLAAFPTTADASSRNNHHNTSTYRSGYSSCGCAIYTKKVISGYDRYHRPVYRYYKVPISHGCRHYAQSSRRYYSNNNYSSNRRYRSSGYRSSGYRSNRIGTSSRVSFSVCR